MVSSIDPLAMGGIGLEWPLFRTGLGANNHFGVGGFIRSRDGVRHPDLQYHFLLIAIACDGKGRRHHSWQAAAAAEVRVGVRPSGVADEAAPGLPRGGLSAATAARPCQTAARRKGVAPCGAARLP